MKRKGDICALCGSQRRLFEPTVLYCNGACGMQRIRRNAAYFTDPSRLNHWCVPCNGLLKETEPITLDDGSEVKKKHLQRLKNDALPEEAWVQCDDCHNWVHQICALFNGRKNKAAASYTCPKCYIKKKDKGVGEKKEKVQSMKSAKDLPHCAMSEAIEMGLLKMLDQAYSDKAKELKCSVDQVDKADSLCVRVVSSMDKKHMVRDEVRRMHCILLNYIFGQFHQCFDDTFKIFCMIYPDVRSLCQEGLPIRVCCKIQVHPPFSEHSWSGCSPVWHVCL